MEQTTRATALDRDSRSYILKLQGDRLIEVADASTLPPFPAGSDLRGLVSGFSPRSAQRMRDYLLAARVDYRVFGTLTYPVWSPRGTDPVAFKRDLRCFLQRASRYIVQQRKFEGHMLTGWSIFWWLEWTGAGVAHFHFFSTDFLGKRWLSAAWADITSECDPRVVAAATRVEMLRGGRAAAARYAYEYASKKGQKTLPDGVTGAGRWWGVAGRRDTAEATIRCKPEYLPSLADCGPIIGFWRALGAMEDAGFARRLDDLPEGVTIWQIPEWHRRDELYHMLRRCRGPFELVGDGWLEDDWFAEADGWVRWINPPQVESSDPP